MILLLLSLIAFLPVVQQTRVDTSGGGDGPVTRNTFATWVGGNAADLGPLRLQVLVLWHGGDTDWLTEPWSADEKGIHTRARSFEFRFHGDSVTIDGQKISLTGFNVILVEVEPTRTRVVETLYIDEVIPVRNTEDPIRAIVRRHPRLAEFAELQP